MDNVVVVIGIRGFGLACARRLAAGKRLLIGDNDPEVLDATARMLEAEGYSVSAAAIDVADPSAASAFAARVPELGRLATLVHTAGISPGMADWEKIFQVNLLGTIHVLDAFLPLVESGTVAIVMASNAAYYTPVPSEIEAGLALAPVDRLKEIVRGVAGHDNGLGAYWLAKRSNQLRVQAQAPEWAAKGARILSVSPGIIATPMIAFEREHGASVAETVAATPLARFGTSEDIAAAVAWLASSQAGFITGTDLLIDGGMISALRWSQMKTDDPTDPSRKTESLQRT